MLCQDAALSAVGTEPTAANGEDPADPGHSWVTGFGWVFLPEEAKLGYTSLWKRCLLSQAFPLSLVPLLVLKMKASRAESRCLSLFHREKEKKPINDQEADLSLKKEQLSNAVALE